LRDPQTWSSLLGRLHTTDWVVYCKPPFAGVDSVYAYAALAATPRACRSPLPRCLEVRRVYEVRSGS